MKKSYIILIAVAAIVLISFMYIRGLHNTMVKYDEDTIAQWANVEVQYQRRADLIPNLVNTVKGFAKQEQEVLTGVIEARSKASSININANDLSPENIQKYQQAQSQLSGSLSRLLATVERYPDLKSNKNFLELQAQLEGTENRVSVERRRFNESVKQYNTYIRIFPNKIFAG